VRFLSFLFLAVSVGALAFAEPAILYYEWYAGPTHLPFEMGKELGIFQKYGIELETLAPGQGGGWLPFQELKAGRGDFGLFQTDMLFYFFAQDKLSPGKDVFLVAPYFDTDPRVLLYRKGENLHLSDLSHVRFGILDPPVVYLTYKNLFSALGLPLEPAFISVWHLEAIAKGITDAGIAWKNDLCYAQSQGMPLEGVELRKYTPWLYYFWIGVSGKTARERPDLVRKFLAATREAITYVVGHPEEAIAYAEKHFPEEERGLECTVSYLTEVQWKPLLGRFPGYDEDRFLQTLRYFCFAFEVGPFAPADLVFKP